jgi:tRNA G10  N-methylase Trm11
MFAMAVPGLASLVRRELEGLEGISVTEVGFDGRADVVLFEADRGRREATLSLRTTEDVFVEVGRTLRSEGDNPRWIAGRIWRPERVERALSAWSAAVRPLSAAITFRVIARVLRERSFVRTVLRDEVNKAIGRDRPKWRVGDPAQLEVWVSEYQPGKLVAGLRLTDVRMRQHEGRQVERQGALRPSVAAAMVGLAGDAQGTLLDPCCGSGTILAEAAAVGWGVAAVDIDSAAVDVALRNVPQAASGVGDARTLDLPDASVGACVSNLPFGRQFDVEGDATTWLADVLGEMARVTRPGGRVVVLSPHVARRAVPSSLKMSERHQIRLLGTKTTVWVFDRMR